MRLIALLFVFLIAAAASAAEDPRRGDEHSYAEPDKVVIRDIGLDLTLDFEHKVLRGSVDLALEWKDRRYRTLVLDTRDLTIEKVLGKRADGGWRKLDFKLDKRDPIFGQKLSISMRRAYPTVRIRYQTSPQASGLQWLEPALTAGKKHPFLFSQSQAIHARSWLPLQDTPGVRFTYSASIQTDPQLAVLMSADNVPDEPRDGKYVFRMRQPISSYLMAIAAGDLVFAPISARVGVWAEPSTVAAAVAEFTDTEKMIEVAESLYGPYRWERYDLLILPPSFPFGGMENPRLSFITPTVIVGDKSLASLISHELAHSWSGNLVTNASWKDMWLNEGFTSYVENRIVEAVFGEPQAAMENMISQNGLRAELKELEPAQQRLLLPPMHGLDPDDALTQVAYIKGQWFLMFLEGRFGRARFDAFIRSWFDAHAFQTASSTDFIGFLRAELLPLEPTAVTEVELEEWLNGEGIPESAPNSESPRFANVDAARTRWLEFKIAANQIDSAEWITQEWVRFLEGLPPTIDGERLVELDAQFRFTGTNNGEIAQRWYPLAERNGYFEARPAMADFLKRIGRRKLVMPIYDALVATKEGLEFAEKVFADARSGYHPITSASVAEVIRAAKAKLTPSASDKNKPVEEES
ncbi:MAG: M1 family metallopeptidase [Pseudomarimonas sp.]